MFACIKNIGNKSPQVFAEQLTFNASGETFNVWSFGGFIGPIGPFRAAVLSRKDNPLGSSSSTFLFILIISSPMIIVLPEILI